MGLTHVRPLKWVQETTGCSSTEVSMDYADAEDNPLLRLIADLHVMDPQVSDPSGLKD